MKRIVIYVQNEEIAALRPFAEKMTKLGALVQFSALKFMELNKADLVLTRQPYLARVKDLFSGTTIPVQVIDEDEAASVVSPEKKAPVKKEAAVIDVPVVLPENDEVVMVVASEVAVEPVAVDVAPEVIVTEDAAPRPAARPRRK